MSEAGFSSQKSTVLKECTNEEQSSVVRFFVGERTQFKDIHKEIFPVYGGKCLSRRAVHNLGENVSLMTERLKLRWESG
jgi:hypothetical protein